MMARLKLVQKLLTLAAFFMAIATTSSTCKCTTSSVVKGIYWSENPIFSPSSINTTHFTHVFYAFLTPNTTTYTLQLPTSKDNNNKTSLTTFTNTLRNKTPTVTTLLSIGGGGSNSSLFAFIASNPTARATFINSTIEVSRTFGFDGIDLDWEFPQNSNEMNSLGELFLQWRYAITAEAVSTRRKPLLLTAAVYFAASVPFPPRMYPIDSINNNLDWINVMTYDLRGSWNNATGAPAGLVNPNSNVTVVGGLISWIRSGVKPEKVAMGMPLYAKTWKLRDPNVNGIGAPSAGVGPGLDGAMAVFQVLEFNNQSGANVVYDVDTASVYSHSGTTWIGYDDPFTVSVKIGLAQALSLRGYFFWAAGLDTSDWKISSQASKSWRITGGVK